MMRRWSNIIALLALAVLAVAGPAQAQEPDDAALGLWLRAPAFPMSETDRVEVLEFTDDRDMDVTTYIRSLDGMVTFEIRRQPIAESELQSPEDVRSLVEMRVGNDDIPEENIKANLGLMEVESDAAGLAKLITYPTAMAAYITGANEDMTMHGAMFVFTDMYCYELLASMPVDSVEEYDPDVQDWFESAQFVERDPYPAGAGDEGAAEE